MMTTKVNHINLGLFHEAYIVCNCETEEYFREVAKELNKEYLVRTGVFVYDKEELTDKVKFDLRFSSNVLFMLTEGETEKAAQGESSPMRQVYSFVQSNNQGSISLVAVDGCQVDYSVEYPEDMKSFMWLHRKNYFISRETAEETAASFFKELRRNHSKTQQRKLNRLRGDGQHIKDDQYKVLSVISAIFGLIFLLIYLLSRQGLWGVDADISKFIYVLEVIVEVFAYSAIPYIMIAFCFFRDVTYDVSKVFSEFRRLGRKRLSFIFGVGLYLTSAVFTNYLYIHTRPQFDATINYPAFGFFMILLIVFAYNTTMWVIAVKTPLFVEFAYRRFLVRAIFLPVFIGVTIYLFFYFRNHFDISIAGVWEYAIDTFLGIW